VTTPVPPELTRHLQLVTTPALWPGWPFLPLVRRSRGRTELGVLFDAFGATGLTGYSATVLLTNVFALPPTVGHLLALPREVFDAAEELLAAGWLPD
jgi:hypothetical protein